MPGSCGISGATPLNIKGRGLNQIIRARAKRMSARGTEIKAKMATLFLISKDNLKKKNRTRIGERRNKYLAPKMMRVFIPLEIGRASAPVSY